MSYQIIKPDLKLGLCLAGGGGLALLHIGLLEAMEELGIRPGIVAGTSAGAIIGALYAEGKSVAQIREIFTVFGWLNIISLPFSQKGFMSTKRMQDFLKKILIHKRIEDLPIRLKIAAVSILDGTYVGFTEGPLAKCLAGASAVPGLFEPVKIGDNTYYDAGGIYNLPLELFAGEGVSRIIAGNTIGKYALMSKPKSIQDVYYQAYLIRSMHLTAMRTGPMGWSGKKNEELILIDYKTHGNRATSVKDCSEHIEETRIKSLEILRNSSAYRK